MQVIHGGLQKITRFVERPHTAIEQNLSDNAGHVNQLHDLIHLRMYIVVCPAVFHKKSLEPRTIKYPKPTISRVLYLLTKVAIIYLGRLSPAASSDLTREVPGIAGGMRRAASPLLFGLAPDGVYPASPVTRTAVSSYLAISPLPPRRDRPCIFCDTFRSITAPCR